MLSNQKNNDRFGFLAKKCIFLDPLIKIFCKSRISLYKMTHPNVVVMLLAMEFASNYFGRNCF